MDQRPRSKEQGSWTKDHGPRTMDQGPRTKDHGPYFGTNEYPRKNTDVILRLSKSTIEDLSFYIGFTMGLMVKMVAFDEMMTFVRFVMKNRFVFEFVFLIWGSFWDFLDIEHIFIEKSKSYKLLDFIFLTS